MRGSPVKIACSLFTTLTLWLCLCMYLCIYIGYLRCTLAPFLWMWPAECGICFVETATVFSSEQLLVSTLSYTFMYPPLHLSLRFLSVSFSPLSVSLSLTLPTLSTSTGVLRLFQNEVMERHTIEEVGQFLGHLPDSVDGDTLFQHISTINLTAKRFSQCLQQHSSSSSS